MVKEIITFGDIEIEKHKSHRYKSATFLNDWDINNIQVYSIVSLGEKSYRYFTGYTGDEYKIKHHAKSADVKMVELNERFS